MRVAFFSPLPPERTGIGDYSYELLEELRNLLDVTAVVSDEVLWSARAPDGVDVVGDSSVLPGEYDCAIYQMGNNPNFHRFIYGRAFEEPGLLVLHDPSLADFTAEMCGDARSTIFRDEVAYDCPAIAPEDDLPLVDAGNGRIDLDRIAVLLARRIVESNVRTLVHSSAMAREMRRRYGGADIATIQLPAQIVPDVPRLEPRRPGEVVFGVFGGINYYKRIMPIVEAFAEVRARRPAARMVIAGRADDRLLEIEVRRLAERPDLAGALEVKTNLPLDELEREMSLCDVGISLRWPTAGEMSATLMRTLGAGRPAIVSDVLQFRELDSRYCWRVTTDFDREHDSLVEIMDAVAADPERCRRAGEAARRFVESEATYRVVAEQYVAHVEHCAAQRARKVASRRHLALGSRSLAGANLFVVRSPGELARGARRLVDALGAGGIDVVAAELSAPLGPAVRDGDRSQPGATVAPGSPGAAGGTPEPGRPGGADGAVDAAARSEHGDRAEAAARATRDRAVLQLAEEEMDRADRDLVTRGPHVVDLYVADDASAGRMGRLARVRRARGHRVVAVLAPSLTPLTTDYRLLLELAEHVWVAGEHGAEVAAMSTSVPARIVAWPACAGVPVERSARSGPCELLAAVEEGTGVAYANPFAVVDAFRAAFPSGERGRLARLTVAFGGSAARPEAAARLAEELARVRGRIVLDPSRGELQALLDESDVVVSLHRAEPVGLLLVDAMACGKVVLATSWSALDGHTSGRDGCRVGYEVREATDADFYLDSESAAPPGAGYLWLEPDVAGAARWMRRLAADPALRGRVGARARKTAETAWLPAAVASQARDALAALVSTVRPADTAAEIVLPHLPGGVRVS